MGRKHTEVTSPGTTAFIGFAAQTEHAQLKSAGAFALHDLSLSCNPGDARDRSLLGRGVLTTPPFVGPFYRSVGAQATAQPSPLKPLSKKWVNGQLCDQMRDRSLNIWFGVYLTFQLYR